MKYFTFKIPVLPYGVIDSRTLYLYNAETFPCVEDSQVYTKHGIYDNNIYRLPYYLLSPISSSFPVSVLHLVSTTDVMNLYLKNLCMKHLSWVSQN